MNDRRKFLTRCCSAVAVSLVTPQTIMAAISELDIAEHVLTKADFIGLLKTRFKFSGVDNNSAARLRLIRVLDFPSTSELEQFSLVFVGGVDNTLPTGLYIAEGGSIGSFEVYIKPTTGNARRQFYMADFSLLK